MPDTVVALGRNDYLKTKNINLVSVFVKLENFQGRVNRLYLTVMLSDDSDWQVAFIMGF